MPLFKKDLYDVPISFEGKNEVRVLVGPCSSTAWKGSTIPLDGRHYRSGGEVILKNGLHLRASFGIQTHHFDLLERDPVYIHLQDGYYRWDEPELLVVLGLTSDQAFPFQWCPDVPLDYRDPGPYPMVWP